jgi:hypothetical protein
MNYTDDYPEHDLSKPLKLGMGRFKFSFNLNSYLMPQQSFDMVNTLKGNLTAATLRRSIKNSPS